MRSREESLEVVSTQDVLKLWGGQGRKRRQGREEEEEKGYKNTKLLLR